MLIFSLVLSLCSVHGRKRLVWSCGVVDWIGRPPISPTPSPGHRKVTLGPAPLNSSANTTKHGLTLPPLHAHNSSTHSNLTFPNTNPQPLPGPYRPLSPPLPATPVMIHSARCVKVPLRREKRFSVTYVAQVGICTASCPPSPPSVTGGKQPYYRPAKG